MRFHAIVQYDGSRYYGFQSQLNQIGIQEVIEKALKNMTQMKIKIHSAGRTDKGVHAIGQSFHFDAEMDIDGEIFAKSLNRRLPLDIRILKISKVNDTFHARHHAISKKYVYKMSKKPLRAFEAYYLHYERDISYERMKDAAKSFEGTHDFSGFSVKVPGKPTVKTIYQIKVYETSKRIHFEFHGNGFLKYMVRSMMGTIIECGLGKKTILDIEENLIRPNRSLAGKTAPSAGLYLKKVYYKKTKDWYNVVR